MTVSIQRRRLLSAAAAMGAGMTAGWAPAALAQGTGDMRLLVPLSAGSSVDIIARCMAPKMSQVLNRGIYADNRPGADSIIATQLAASAKPDGQTVVLVTPAHAINVFMYPGKLKYDAVKDFTLIGMAATNVNVLMVPAESPFHSLQDLVAAAKAKPSGMNYGNSGGTSGGAAELLNLYAGIKTINVSYKGAGEAMNDMLGNRLDFIFSAISTALPMVKSGKLRGLAQTGAQRHPSLPDLPTVAESFPGFQVLGWYGLLGPRGLSPETTQRLNHALAVAAAAPEVRKTLAANGFDPAQPNTPEDFRKFVEAEIVKWGKVIKPVGEA
jgi:tripartite-type tricarboxylate transporter receptor subunit TctC